MKEYLPAIKYQIPLGETDNPFDTNSNKRYFINASGFSYSTDNVLLFQNPYMNKLIIDYIPIGYKAITVWEKRAIISSGESIREWPAGTISIDPRPSSPLINKYQIYCSFEVNPKSLYYRHYFAPPMHNKLPDREFFGDQLWEDYDVAKRRTVELSLSYPEELFYLNKLLLWEQWH